MQAERDSPFAGRQRRTFQEDITATPVSHPTPLTLSAVKTPAVPHRFTDAPGGAPEPPARFSGSGAPVVSPSPEPQPANSEAMAIAAASVVRQAFIAAPPYPASSRARAKTASSISSVSLPVKVFCWLG